MTTSKWYNYGAIPTDDEYEVSSSAAATITYTQNGTQLASSATGTSVSFTAGETKNISLSAGQLYLKSDAATTLSISYKYNVGSATASHAYVQGGETVTITYADASTNDPTATFAKNISGITFNGTAITNYEGATTDKGFTFIVPTVTAGTDYILSIPADAFGYSEGNTYNAAQDIIFKTPALFDGIYYLQAQDGSYVGRGSSYGTRACVNPWGLPLNLATDAEGITTLQYYDTNLYVYVTDDKTAVYADNSNNNSWTLTASGSGTYNIKSVYADSYLTISGSDLALSETPYSWTAHNGTAHKAQMTANKNCQAATAATAAGLSSITTTSELESAVSGWNFTPVIEPASVTTTTESYNPFYNWQATLTTYSADVAIATSGLYKLTIQGFGRLTGNDEVSALQQENADVSPFYAFFGDVTTPLMSVMDLENNTTNYGNNCVQYGGYYYPNGQDGAKAAFQDNKYENTIWVYISSPGTYSYGIKIDGCASVDNGRWCCYTTNSISLSLYSENYWSVFKAAMTSHAPYSDISAADDATGYTTQYNTYLTYTESTDVATLSAAVDYMKNNYANYQWVNASITHPVDVTEGIINGWECTSNDAWLGSGRTDGTGTYYDGSSRTYFTQNHEDGAARSQAVAIPEVGAYLLRTVVRPVYDASYATITIGDESTTTRGIQTGSANIGNGWAYNDIYFATTSADENKTISIALSNVNSGREADCGEMHLLYIGQNADFVKDGIHKYIGTFATAPSLEVTDEVPVIDIKGATFTSGSSAVTFTNPNGLVFVKEDDQTSAAKNEVVGTTCASLQLEKGHPFVNPTEFTATAAKYTLGTGELADGKFATLMVPFAANVPSGGKAYTLDQGINLIDGNIYATEASSIAANSPVLVTAAGNYSGSNVTVPVVASGATFTSGELVGTYTALTAPERSYVLQNHTSGEGVAFYLVGTTKPTVNPFRAYIKKQASAVRAIHVVFDETDGIENVQHPTSNVQHYYDLQGRRVAKPEKGLYIVNGRKTVVQ
ncbi:MAG: hypothetical protein J5552_04980 [Prevotella sp.]|nr:hypothetical protein [Prevotella sp.]